MIIVSIETQCTDIMNSLVMNTYFRVNNCISDFLFRNLLSSSFESVPD